MALSRFISEFDDWINPIAVKELRQAVKGRFVTWVLMVFLLIQLVIIESVLIFSEDLSQNFSVGSAVFSGLLGVLLGTCIFFLPAATAVRLSSERSESNVDLLFTTTLKPVQIIWGKFSAALVLTLLFFSAFAPFMTLTYLLRGFDLPSVFIVLTFDFLIISCCIQLGMLLACLPGKIIGRGLLFLCGIFVMIAVFQSTLMASLTMVSEGIASNIDSWDFWGTALTVAAFILIGIGLFFVLSVAIITPASANRAYGVRIYLLLMWIVTGVIAGIWSFAKNDKSSTQTWMIVMVLVFSAKMFISICERQEWGPRIKRTIPTKRALRIPAFLLYSGAAGGMIFSAVMVVATILLSFLCEKIFAWGAGTRSSNEHAYRIATSFALYACCYSLTALAIKRVFFWRSNRPDLTIVIALLLLVAGSVIPMSVGFLSRSNLSHGLSPLWFIGNPFMLLWEKDKWMECLTFTSIWALGAFAVMLSWFLRQFRSFKPASQTQIVA